jgi:2-polyprenyl-3-methyl-5-hydroxy-6-metoxy-1,4-benzoquinol methylase
MYYNWSKGKKIDTENSCRIDQWLSGTSDTEFAETSEGVKVFLPPTELSQSDEHEHGDPYNVKEGLEKDNFFEKRRLKCTKRLLKKGEVDSVKEGDIRILDVGCGEGYITAAVHDLFPTATMVGVDYSISAVRRAAARETSIEWVVADAHNLPFQPDYFDITICTNVWEHVPNPIGLLRGLNKITRDGGFFLMSTPSRYRVRNLIRVLMGKEVIFMSNNHVTEYTVGQVKEYLKFFDMNVISVDSIIAKSPQNLTPSSILQWLLSWIGQEVLNAFNSHHILQSTAFYLSRFNKK